MNPRIRELAAQAGFDVERLMAPYPGGFPLEGMLALEGFAELIALKCAELASDVGTNTVPEDFALDKCYEIESKIKKHFGIE